MPVIILGSVIVGFLCLVFDLVLEPVAMRLDYWQWSTGIVPIRNYVALFVIAATASVPGFMLRGIRSSRLPAYYIVVQFLFIASLLPA